MKKINFHYTIFISLIISFFIGIYKEFFIVLLTLFIHEMGHLFFIIIFKKEVKRIILYPFGGVIEYDDKPDKLYKNFLISVGGILFNFFFYFLFKLLSIDLFAKLNLLFIFINLLPIYPLDGSRMLFSLFNIIFPYKISKVLISTFSLVLSVIFFPFLLYFYNAFVLILILFIFIKINIMNLVNLQINYQSYALEKYLYPNSHLKEKRTRFWIDDPFNSLFYGRNMLFDYEQFVIDEKVILEDHFKNKKMKLFE